MRLKKLAWTQDQTGRAGLPVLDTVGSIPIASDDEIP